MFNLLLTSFLSFFPFNPPVPVPVLNSSLLLPFVSPFHLLPLYSFCLPSFLPILNTSTERPQPPRKLAVPQDGVEARRVRLHWVTGGSGSSPLRYFTLQVKQLPSGDWSTHTADIPHNVTVWTIDRYTRVHIRTVTHLSTRCHLIWRQCRDFLKPNSSPKQ